MAILFNERLIPFHAMKTMVSRETLKGRINASFFFPLADLVEKGALRKTEKLRHTCYWLNIDVETKR